MNEGLLSGVEYGAPLKAMRRKIKIGQGNGQYLGDMVILGTTDDITGQTTRSQGIAPQTARQDFVIQAPVTRGVNDVPLVSTAMMLSIPDGGIKGGNKRGDGAIDLQYYRDANTQVASGLRSVILGNRNVASGQDSVSIGYSNTSSGTNSTSVGSNNLNTSSGTALGYNNTAGGASSTVVGISNSASTSQAVAVGSSNTASGNSSVALGYSNTASNTTASAIGSSNNASGTRSVALGYNHLANGNSSSSIGSDGTTHSISGKNVISSLMITTRGDNQKGTYLYKQRTTNNTPTIITTNSLAATTTNQIILSDYSTFSFSGIIQALKQSVPAYAKSWKIEGIIQRGAGAASTFLIASSITLIGQSTGLSDATLALTADTTNGGLAITGTGIAATNIQWTGYVDCAESIYV